MSFVFCTTLRHASMTNSEIRIADRVDDVYWLANRNNTPRNASTHSKQQGLESCSKRVRTHAREQLGQQKPSLQVSLPGAPTTLDRKQTINLLVFEMVRGALGVIQNPSYAGRIWDDATTPLARRVLPPKATTAVRTVTSQTELQPSLQ